MPFILTIGELGGSWAGRDPVTSIHASRLEARATLIEYVRDKLGRRLVERYFRAVPETYQITEARD